MLQIFNTVEDGLQELDQVTEGCWVRKRLCCDFGGHPFLRRKRQVCDDSSWYLYDRKDDCDRMPGRDTGIKSIYEQP